MFADYLVIVDEVHNHSDVTFVCKLDCVGDHVENDLTESRFVQKDKVRHFLRKIVLEFDFLFPCFELY